MPPPPLNFRKSWTTAGWYERARPPCWRISELLKAYALQGDTVKARAAYQDFLTLWKDADLDIPVYRAAKAEYAKLQ